MQAPFLLFDWVGIISYILFDGVQGGSYALASSARVNVLNTGLLEIVIDS